VVVVAFATSSTPTTEKDIQRASGGALEKEKKPTTTGLILLTARAKIWLPRVFLFAGAASDPKRHPGLGPPKSRSRKRAREAGIPASRYS
jgi:hypothetical protein